MTYLIGLTPDQLKALPTSGAGWSNITTQSDKALTVDLGQGAIASTAGAYAFCAGLRFARTGSTVHRDKVTTALRQLVAWSGTPYYSAVQRQLAGWVLAADLIGYRDPAFISWLSTMRTKTLAGNTRWGTVVKSATDSANNHGACARVSLLAANLYLADSLGVARDIKLMRGWLGDRTQWSTATTTSSSGVPGAFQVNGGGGWDYAKTWAQNPTVWTPVSAAGPDPKKNGCLPMDVYRETGSYPVIGDKGVMYHFTALQAAVQAAVLLAGNGHPDVWQWSDRALLRARTWINTYGGAAGKVHPYPGMTGFADPVLNHVYGTTYPAVDGLSYGLTGTRWLAQSAAWLR